MPRFHITPFFDRLGRGSAVALGFCLPISVALDNVLWGGSVVKVEDTEPSTLALRDVSDHIARDPRVQSVMLHVSDGLTLARKLP